jgi:RNA polymerase sigma-70 factor, ECF subfamily
VTGEYEAQPSDAELLRRHIQGDHEAFGELFARHRERLWAVALRTLGDTEEAADALQEAMISAFRRAGSFRGDSAVTTWLHRIVVNACLDRVRRRVARPTMPAGDEHSLDTLTRSGATIGDPVSDHDTVLDVDAALRMLPYEQRAALVLVDMLGYPVQAAADMLDVSVGTIKSRCARGRARLAPYLSHLRNRPGAGDVSPSQADLGSRGGRARDQRVEDPVGQPLEGGGERV